MRLSLMILVAFAGLLLCFPPYRKAGHWGDPRSGAAAPTSVAHEYDRFLFGYLPRHGWAGDLGTVVEMGRCSVTFAHWGYPEMETDRYRIVVDWLWVVIESVVVIALCGAMQWWNSGKNEALHRPT